MTEQRRPPHRDNVRPLRLPRLPRPTRHADSDDDDWINEWEKPHLDRVH